MPLDSDVANADAHLHVEFYESPRISDAGAVFVRIITPGDKTNIIDQPARDHHKERFVRQWLHFQAKNAGDSIPGTKLEEWHERRPDEITDGQLMELQILKFQTVEQVAQASDLQIQKVGMGAAGLRERARLYLASKNGADASGQMARMQEQFALLQSQFQQATAEIAALRAPVAKKKPGRPKKVTVNADHNASVGAAGNE